MKTTRKEFLETAAAAGLNLTALSTVAALSGANPASAATPAAQPVRYDFAWNRRDHTRLASRSVLRPQSLYFDKPNVRPTPVNLEGRVSFYPQDRVHAARERLKGVDANAYLGDILDRILVGQRTDRERVAAVCKFVGDAIYYNPTHCAFCSTDDG